jgi:hypothetical protein
VDETGLERTQVGVEVGHESDAHGVSCKWYARP